MAICRSCSSELSGRDRYCRNCGALVPPVVAEFDDTRRFDPSAPLPPDPAGPPDTTNPLYAQHYAAYVAPQGVGSLPQTESLIKRVFRKRFFRGLTMVALLSIFLGVGVGIGRNFARNHGEENQGTPVAEQEVEDTDAVRQKYEEAVQNALGFKQGEYSATEFPDTQGIFVNNLMRDDSPAALAKIQAGDLITKLNGQQVRNDSELSTVLKKLQTGQEYSVEVYRDGTTISSRIKIADPALPPTHPEIAPEEQGFLGILDSSRHCCIPGTKKWGVEVKELHINSPAELFGLREGDLITEFNGRPVKTPNEFNRYIRAVNPQSKGVLKFYRGGKEMKIEVIMGHRWE